MSGARAEQWGTCGGIGHAREVGVIGVERWLEFTNFYVCQLDWRAAVTCDARDGGFVRTTNDLEAYCHSQGDCLRSRSHCGFDALLQLLLHNRRKAFTRRIPRRIRCTFGYISNQVEYRRVQSRREARTCHSNACAHPRLKAGTGTIVKEIRRALAFASTIKLIHGRPDVGLLHPQAQNIHILRMVMSHVSATPLKATFLTIDS